jgi:hypothetical protein
MLITNSNFIKVTANFYPHKLKKGEIAAGTKKNDTFVSPRNGIGVPP